MRTKNKGSLSFESKVLKQKQQSVAVAVAVVVSKTLYYLGGDDAITWSTAMTFAIIRTSRQ